MINIKKEYQIELLQYFSKKNYSTNEILKKRLPNKDLHNYTLQKISTKNIDNNSKHKMFQMYVESYSKEGQELLFNRVDKMFDNDCAVDNLLDV